MIWPLPFGIFKTGYEALPETLSYLWKRMVNNPIAIQASALAGGFNLNLTSLKDIEIYTRGVASLDLDAFIAIFEHMMKFDGQPSLIESTAPFLLFQAVRTPSPRSAFRKT